MKRLKKVLFCVTIAFALLAVALLTLVKAKQHFCPDKEAQRIESPDRRYVVTHVIEDPCGGSTVAFLRTVYLSRRDVQKDIAVLLETYRSPTGIEIRWADSAHIELIAKGMDNVTLLKVYEKARWSDVTVRILLR